jgi:hypothetical protein
MGKDFWLYGMQGNRKTVAKFIGYLRPQDLLKSEIKADDLFARELHGSSYPAIDIAPLFSRIPSLR